MAYKKIGFKDRIDNKPTTYLVDGKSTEIIKDDTDVEEEGTNLNATNLNHMEDGILQNSRDIEILNKQIINIKVPVESVNGKTGDVELKAQDIKSKSGTTLEDFKSNTEEEIKNLKSSVDNGKNSLYSAVVDKKVTPRSKDFDDLAKGIREIKLGQGNAQPNDVLEGKTFTNAEGNLLTGKMKNYGSKIITPSKEIQTLDKGYYDNIKINAIDKEVLQSNFPELKPENIKKNVNIGGVVGTAKALNTFMQNYELERVENLTATPYWGVTQDTFNFNTTIDTTLYKAIITIEQKEKQETFQYINYSKIQPFTDIQIGDKNDNFYVTVRNFYNNDNIQSTIHFYDDTFRIIIYNNKIFIEYSNSRTFERPYTKINIKIEYF